MDTKKFLNAIFICIAIASASSCVSHKRYAKGDSKTVSRLSGLFGVRLTPADNLALYDACSQWLGVKYRNGGNTKRGVDCSGFASAIYKQVYGKRLERSSAGMLKKNCTPIKRGNLREGDLVFFKTLGGGSPKTPTHVGIYLKNGKFVHASTSKGVTVSSLSEPYYVRTWITGGRAIHN